MNYGKISGFFLLLFLGSVQSLTAAQATVRAQASNAVPVHAGARTTFVCGCRALHRNIKFFATLFATHMQEFGEWLQEELISLPDDDADVNCILTFDPDRAPTPLQEEESKVTIFKAAYAHRHGTPIPEEEQKNHGQSSRTFVELGESDEIHETIETVEEQKQLDALVQPENEPFDIAEYEFVAKE